MSKRLGVVLLSLPILSLGIASAIAAPPSEPETAAGVSAPAHDHAAIPAGCNGCAGHDCANCPLALADAQTNQAPSAVAEIRCGAN